jgi:hypothetical protein
MCNNLKACVVPGLTLNFPHLPYTVFGFTVVRKQQMSPSTAFTNSISSEISPLNAELNPICHLLVYPTRCNVTQFIYIWKLLYIAPILLT